MKPATHATIQGKIGGHVLAAGFAAVALLIYATLLLPHQFRNRQQAQKVQSLTRDIDAARVVVQRVRDLEFLTSEARAALNSRLGDLAGRPMEEWLPQVVRAYFEGAMPLDIALHPDGVWNEEGLPGYQRNAWKAQVSVASGGDAVDRLMKAVAELAAAGPFIKVVDLVVRPNPQNAGQLDCAMTLVVLDRAAAR